MTFATAFVEARVSQQRADRMRSAGYSLPPSVAEAPGELRRNTPAPTMPKQRVRVTSPRFRIHGRDAVLGEVLEVDLDLACDLAARGLAERI